MQARDEQDQPHDQEAKSCDLQENLSQAGARDQYDRITAR
jgi:hypothetical protein